MHQRTTILFLIAGSEGAWVAEREASPSRVRDRTKRAAEESQAAPQAAGEARVALVTDRLEVR